MPFYDDGKERTRKLFLESMRSVEKQTFRDYEIVMVVSGEREFSEQVARKNRKVRLVYFSQKAIETGKRPLGEKVSGLVMARNLLLKNARGEFIAYVDCDDISLPPRLEKEYRFLKEHPEIGVVGSSTIMIDGQGKELGIRRAFETDEKIRGHMLQFNPVPQPTVMARLAIIRKAGGYRPGEIPEDYDLWVRVAKLTKFHNFKEPLVKYRVHEGGGVSIYKLPLYTGSLRVKWRAFRTLGLCPGPKDIAVNAFQFISLFFPNSLRRTLLEKIRGKVVVGE